MNKRQAKRQKARAAAKQKGSMPPRDPTDNPSSNEASNNHDSTEQGRSKLSKAPVWIEALCAIALVIITGLYTHYARRQVQAANKTLREIVASRELDHRAWVGMDTETKTTLLIRNFGNTPANNATDQVFGHRVDAVSTPITKELGDSWVNSSPLLQIGVIFPGQHVAPSSRENIHAMLDAPAVKKGASRVYLLGRIKYYTFTKTHTTRFCWEWFPEVNGWDPGGDCKDYNSSD
ncbi:MAG: hypothetical protein H0X25_07945 [Acidobacteriales bacterium]|nr:hypothetical protein [Terriglobales bacterium]